MKIFRVPYHGWTDCIQISTGTMQLIITTQVGPRVIFLGFPSGENLFYENPEQAGTTGGEIWKIYGGHRLWTAPEDLNTTYLPDNSPVEVQESANLVRFISPVDTRGVQKVIEFSFDESTTQAQVKHTLTNHGASPVALAPWAVSVMRTGGVAVVPHSLEPYDQVTPTRTIALWGYTRMADPRWTWGNRFILLRQDPAAENAQKFGTQNQAGWAAYAVDGQLFVKRFPWTPDALYPDFDCNFEAYTKADFLEIESLGPRRILATGESATHLENWSLYRDIPVPRSEQDVEKWILPVIG